MVAGTIVKSSSQDDVIAAIRSVMEGGRIGSREIQHSFKNLHFGSPTPLQPFPNPDMDATNHPANTLHPRLNHPPGRIQELHDSNTTILEWVYNIILRSGREFA